MEFLSKHYEKLILAFCLICLLSGIMIVSMSFTKTRQTLVAEMKTVKNSVKQGDFIEKEKAGDYKIEKFLNDTRKLVNVLGPQDRENPKGSLIEPNKLIVCKNEECGYLILLSQAKCPFCGTEQPELAKETGAGDDTDNDGLPDKFEAQHAFLNYRNPNDALADYDNDGFLNIEEYKEKTKLDDPNDFPALGLLLRFKKIYKNNLPIKLIDVDKNRSDDTSKWDVTVNAYDPKTRKFKRQMKAIGDEVAGFKINSAGFNGEIPYVNVTSIADKEQYRLIQNKDTQAKNFTVQLVYLYSRDRQYAWNISSRPLVKNVGDEFQLVKAKNNARYTENYKLVFADDKGGTDKKGTVKVALLKEAGGAVEREIEVKQLNPQEDFISPNAGGGFDQGMMPGGPMMEPDRNVGPAARGGRGQRGGF